MTAELLCDLTWPVDSLVAADSAEPRPLARPRPRHAPGHAQVTQAAVPAPALLVLHALRLLRLLLPLEVRLGEGLHGGEEAHLGHLPAQGHRLGWLLALATVHGEGGVTEDQDLELSHILDSPNRSRLSDHCLFSSGIIGNSFYSRQSALLSPRLAPDTQAAASLDIYIKSVFISHCHKFPELGTGTRIIKYSEATFFVSISSKISSQHLHCPQFLSIYEYKEVFLV